MGETTTTEGSTLCGAFDMVQILAKLVSRMSGSKLFGVWLFCLLTLPYHSEGNRIW